MWRHDSVNKFAYSTDWRWIMSKQQFVSPDIKLLWRVCQRAIYWLRSWFMRQAKRHFIFCHMMRPTSQSGVHSLLVQRLYSSSRFSTFRMRRSLTVCWNSQLNSCYHMGQLNICQCIASESYSFQALKTMIKLKENLLSHLDHRTCKSPSLPNTW